MKETGSLLKSAREEKNISLEEVASATKIHISTLRAIEEGDVNNLPQIVFVRGFVQTYALFLKIDPKPILEIFKEETIGWQEVESSSQTYNEDEGSQRAVSAANKSSNTARSILIGAGAFILILLIGYLQKVIKKYEQEARIPAEIVVEEGDAVVQEDLPSTTVTTIVKAKKQPTKKVVEVKKESTTTFSIVAPSSTTIVRMRPQELIVEALDFVSIKYRIDGDSQKEVQFRPDQIHTFKAKRNLEVEFSDGGRVSVIHNGRDVGVPGILGESIRMKYP